MEFEGIVFKKLPATSGTSARGEWHRQDVVFEIVSQSPYPRKACITFFNKQDEVARLVVGAKYIVSFDIESREFKERWYTDLRAWKVEPKEAAQVAQAAEVPQVDVPMPTAEPSMPAMESTPIDDLPF
jgi:hypothetical protein